MVDQDPFARGAGGEHESIGDYVGQTLELVELVKLDDGKNYTSVVFSALVGDELKEFWSSSGGVVDRIIKANEAGQLAGRKVVVISGTGSFGKAWYDIVRPEDVDA